MGNNMDLNYEMFCYQCEQTAGGKGCTKLGVCGKTPEIANLQDLLIFQIKGISCYGKVLVEQGQHMDKSIVSFIENVLFTTLTNVNFDADVHVALLRQSQQIKEELHNLVGEISNSTLHATYHLPDSKTDMLKDAPMAGIMYDKSLDPDIRSLRQTILYGLKGISAYGHQARELDYFSDEVDDFYILALEAITDDRLTVEDLIRLTMRTGEMAIEVMKKLDDANTTIYGNPSPHKVNVTIKKGPFIIVSGHDLNDLEMLLKQTEGTGINIYTHGEMLPCHGYDGLKKYSHLVGNFGGAWQDQQKQFDNIPGCILMTTNCLMRPRDSYKDRIYSTNVVGWDGVKHVGRKENGDKDFSEIIKQAIELGGFQEDQPAKEILVGFGHHAALSYAPQLVEAVKSGQIRHFFLICELFPHAISAIFTSDEELIDIASRGVRIAVAIFPLVGAQIVIGNFFQSIGKAKISIFLSLTRQLLYLLPGLLIFPHYFGLDGIWICMPVSDFFAFVTAAVALWIYVKRLPTGITEKAR